MAPSLLVLSILLALIGCGPRPADHGTAYLIGIDTNQLAATDNLDDVLRIRQKAKGAKIFEEVTTQYSPKGNKYFQLAIVLDGRLYSAPRILGRIPGGRGQITGNFSLNEATTLANVLENPIEPPHRILEAKSF
jgi:hypothetical protein